MADQKVEMIRGLTLTDTTALVVGTVIGTGVFLKTAIMAQDVGAPWLVLAAWVAAGLLSLAGALTYAELGAMLPHAGGEYVYLRQAYGETTAFMFGWMRFAVAGSGSIAILGTGVATFLSAVFPLTTVWAERHFQFLGQSIHWRLGTLQLVAVVVILLFALVNCLAVAFGGKVQSILTVLKIGGIIVVVGGVFLFSGGASWAHLATPSGEGAIPVGGLAAFGTAMMAALWAYDGWNNMPMAAGEVQNPGRNIPRALILGMVAVTVVYCIANLAYFYALPFGEVITSSSTKYRDALPVATKAAQTFLGDYGGRIVSIAFILSALGALNGSILANARVPYAMARDGLFFSRMERLHPSSRVPVWAILIQAVWAAILALSGTFDQLTDYVIFASWIFYALVTSSVFVLRRHQPNLARPYRTIGYPWVPLVFVLVAIWLVVNSLFTRPVEAAIGLGLIVLGLPLYLYFRASKSRRGEG